ncbi:MAG: hypothetical protein IT378_16385, partial [Sandaracinaceae bacterium]|nr:hypothetical protein [Sandaracinaceae bacterium]
MRDRALAPSPIALFLLGLAERGADGSVDVGGRQVILRKGQVVDVRPAEGDGDLIAFLRDSGRADVAALEAAQRDARETGTPVEQLLVERDLIAANTLRDVRRRLWLDRLVRGMARVAAEGREPAPLQPDVRTASEGAATNLVSLILDALERRAADADAGQVGAR